MSGKCKTKNRKSTVTNKSVSAKPTNKNDHDKRGSKSTFKSVRHFDPYPSHDLNLDTIYKTVKERRIVTALSTMPVEFFKTLCYHGWILKTNPPNSKYSNKTLGSLHSNVNFARKMAEKHDAGLIWTNDVFSGKVPWSTLKPWVVVNRFPRNGCTEIKLCGHGMVGKSEYDGYHPRTYPNTTVDSGFMEDFALTACVSLLRMFTDKIVKCKESGKVPLSALRFAVEKCSAYITDGKLVDIITGENSAEWETFFYHYRKIVNGKRNFAVSRSDYAELRYLRTTTRDLVEELNGSRPQTMRIDGYNNIWILKHKRPATSGSILFNDVEDALKYCPGLNSGGDDYVVQKYIETPLLNGAHKFMLDALLVISTLEDRLSVWLYHTCFMQTSMYEFSLDLDGHRYSPNAHLMQILDRMHATTCTVGLRRLKHKFNTMAGDANGTRGADRTVAVSSMIRSSIVSAVMAAVNTGTVLNLRPNCFELFQATFVVGNDLQPWLINIRSDPTPTHLFKFTMQHTANDIAKNMANIIVCKNRESKNKIGKFELLHAGTIPGNVYEPRSFVVTPVPKKPIYNYCGNDYDYVEIFPSEDSGRGVAHSDDDSENDSELDFEDDLIKLKPLKRMCDGGKINQELFKNYLCALDQMKSNLDIIRNYYINGQLH